MFGRLRPVREPVVSGDFNWIRVRGMVLVNGVRLLIEFS